MSQSLMLQAKSLIICQPWPQPSEKSPAQLKCHLFEWFNTVSFNSYLLFVFSAARRHNDL